MSLLRGSKKFRATALIFAVSLFLASFLLVLYCWFNLLPQVWNWGFSALHWKVIPGFVAVMFLAILPIYAPFLTGIGCVKILSLYGEEVESQLSLAVNRASQAQGEAEEYLQRQLGTEHSAGLVPLMRYSRVQLESYYKIGLNQTQRSFRYSITAMWIGFFIIILGIVYQVVPFEEYGLPKANTDIKMISLAGGGIVELISALFLWVYRSSIAQLTYFYNRQIYNHGVLMAYRIAQTMDQGDDTKKMIVEKMMSQAWTVERPGAPSGAGFKKLIHGGQQG